MALASLWSAWLDVRGARKRGTSGAPRSSIELGLGLLPIGERGYGHPGWDLALGSCGNCECTGSLRLAVTWAQPHRLMTAVLNRHSAPSHLQNGGRWRPSSAAFSSIRPEACVLKRLDRAVHVALSNQVHTQRFSLEIVALRRSIALPVHRHLPGRRSSAVGRSRA